MAIQVPDFRHPPEYLGEAFKNPSEVHETSPEPNASLEDLPCHAKSVEQCLADLKSSLQGLSMEEAEARLSTSDGHISTGFASRLSRPRQAFLGTFRSRIAWMFLVAACASLYTGHPLEGTLILLSIAANGLVQALIQSLVHNRRFLHGGTLRLRELHCRVRRDGQSQSVNIHTLVPGEILLVETGEILPADCRLLSGYQLQTDESSLTGESVLVPKNAAVILHAAEDISAQCNMLFAGSVVRTGRGEALVTSVGTRTVMGKVAALADATEKRDSPLTCRIRTVSMRIFMGSLALCVVIVGIGLWRHTPVPLLIQGVILLMLAACPGTLPALASLTIVLGIRRLQGKKVLVKNFQALDTLADVSVVCCDKTGTLTENYLLLNRLFLPGLGAVPYNSDWLTGAPFPQESVRELLRIGRLNNGVVLEGLRSPVMGDPVDVALYRAAPAALEAGYHPRLRLPFDPVRLRSATLCETPSGEMIAMIKGAPESVLETCRYAMMPDGSVTVLSLTHRSEFLHHNRKLAAENHCRIIGFALKRMTDNDHPYEDAVFVGWACLQDPPRPGVVETIRRLRAVGARLIMITGDQKSTAETTARELGILHRKSDEIWLRSDLDTWNGPDIPDCVRVFARTRPEEKLAIVASLQQGERVVMMIGDGVNDAPALQKSDVSVAMGLQGAEAARNSADILLLNDRLEGLPEAIRESRSIRIKIHACMQYLISCNLSIMGFVSLAFLMGLGLPVGVSPMLWLTLVVISVPTLALILDPRERDALEDTVCNFEEETPDAVKWRYRPQSVRTEPFIQNGLLRRHAETLQTGYWAILIASAALVAYTVCDFVLKQPVSVAATTAFFTLGVAQTARLFHMRMTDSPCPEGQTFATGLAGAPITWLVPGVTLSLQALVIYLPGVNTLMGLAPLPPLSILIATVFGAGVMLLLPKIPTLEPGGRN